MDSHKQRRLWFWLAVFIASVLSRYFFMMDNPGERDAVDFALALKRYDLLAMQPHFPGYPVYILLAKMVDGLFLQPYTALSFISLLAGAALLPAVSRVGAYLTGKPLNMAVAVLLLSNPLLWMLSEQPISDMTGIAMVWLCLALLAGWLERYGESERTGGALACRCFNPETVAGYRNGPILIPVMVSFLTGLLVLGVRLSFYPFILLMLLPVVLIGINQGWRKSLVAMLLLLLAGTVGTLIWVVPASAGEGGIAGYLWLGTQFTRGHLSDWGGTAFAADGGGLFERFVLLCSHLWVVGLGGLAPDMFGREETETLFFRGMNTAIWLLPLLLWLFNIFEKNQRELVRQPYQRQGVIHGLYKPKALFIILSALPYGLWLYLGQNIEKPRHIAVLLPFILIGWVNWLARSMKTMRAVWLTVLLLAIGQAAVTLPLVANYREASPVTHLALDIKRLPGHERVVVYAWEEERVIQVFVPDVTVVIVRNARQFYQSVLNYGQTRQFYITASLLNGLGKEKEKVVPHLRLIASYQKSPIAYPTYNEVALFRADEGFYPFVRKRAAILQRETPVSQGQKEDTVEEGIPL